MKVYLVGGSVRDKLLNLPVYDHDWVVVGSSPAAMLAQNFIQVGKDFPVFLHPETKEEYALARTERKQGVGYHGFVMSFDDSISLEEDLIRRDLTINAIAQDEDGNLIDPYNGVKDIENKILRHISPAFAEDPLRVLRIARLGAKLFALNFTIADETIQLMKQMVASGELNNLTPERVWQEIVKALSTEKPSVFFEILNQVGAVEVLFPTLHNLIGVEQPLKYHPEGDVWNHSMMALDAAALLSTEIDIRFSALVHDLGKGLTPKELYPKHHGHEKAGVPLVIEFCEKYKVPNNIRKLAEKVTEFHGVIHQGLDINNQPYLKPKTYLKIIAACIGLKNDVFFNKVLTVCEADIKGRLGFENRDYPQKEFWQKLAFSANDIDNKKILATLDTGIQGIVIGVAITKQRRNNIKTYIKHFSINT